MSAPGQGSADPYEALMGRRHGDPLPEPTCPHLTRDFYGNCWGCAEERRTRETQAEAWDDCAQQALRLGLLDDAATEALTAHNPYRTTTSTPGGTRD